MRSVLKSFPYYLGPLLSLVITLSCTKDVGKKKIPPEPNNYPADVATIISNKCATSGCHNSISADIAAGLNLETWSELFKGSRRESVVIPFRPDFSTLMFYINSYNEFGTIQLTPKMPLNKPALTAAEVKVIYDWIKRGAPDASGNIPFQTTAGKKNFYVANQNCDVVTVFDAQSMLASRYIDVGESRGIESPHMLRVSPDNQHWYVSFIGGGYFQKFKTSDNSLVGKVNLGMGSWNTFVITADSRKAFAIDFNSPGKIAEVDLVNMTHSVAIGYNFPHGSALGKNDEYLYVTSQVGNFIYKFRVDDLGNEQKIILDGSGAMKTFSSLDPHEIIFSPDHSKYFITCQKTNEVRVMQTSNDSLLAVIKTGIFPQELALSKTSPYLFVTCTNDNVTHAEGEGSVSVINYQTNTFVKSIYAGFQPHGIAVDDENRRVYIANRNISTDGPPPHHQGVCAGRNGYITAIDLTTLMPIANFKAEVSIDPYGLAIMN